MNATTSIFLDLNLPNSATWFYFSLFLTIALFFQFGRVWSLRNWDLLALFLFVPGFLIIQEANQIWQLQSADGDNERLLTRAKRMKFVGYAWLLSASLYWFIRCLIDLLGNRRPLVSPNLSTAGLFWFAGSLLACMTTAAMTRPADPWQAVGKRPAAVTGVEVGATAVVANSQSGRNPIDIRLLVERTLAMLGHLAIVIGLTLIGWRIFGDLATGASASVLYLLIPYTGFHVDQVHHVLPAALMVWAVYVYSSPMLAGILIGVAGGTAFFPLLLLPVWMQFYRGRGMDRFLLGAILAGLAGLTLTIWVLASTGDFPDNLSRTLHLSDWQPWQRPTAESIWTGAHWAYRLPIFILYAGFVLTSWLWPPVRNLGHLLAVSAAVVIGIQFWFADRGGLYVLWYAPLVMLVILRPNLTDVQAPEPGPWPGFVLRVTSWVMRRIFGPKRTDMLPATVPSSLASPPAALDPASDPGYVGVPTRRT